MKKVLIFVLCFCVIEAFSQENQKIAVKSFKALPADNTARIDDPVYDQNGEKCALIKVVTSEKGFAFEAGTIGVMKTQQEVGEIWVYLPWGAKKFTIKHDKLGVLRDYLFPENIEQASVYEMVLITGKVVVTVEEAQIFTEWVTINTVPDSADVFFDDVLVGKTPHQQKLKEGKYNYRITKSWYYNEAGVFDLSANTGRIDLSFNLREAFGYASITTSPENDAEIEIDGILLNKKSPCESHRLKSGTYTVTAKKIMYEPKSQTITINDGQTTDVNIVLKPNFTNVKITTESEAKIFVDGELTATGTYSGRLMPGLHSFTARKEKYYDATQNLELQAGVDKTFSLHPLPITGSVDIISKPFDAQFTIKSTDADNDNTYDGTTPKTLRNVLIGNYIATITKSGYKTQSKSFTVTENISTEVNVDLKKEDVPDLPKQEKKETPANKPVTDYNAKHKLLIAYNATVYAPIGFKLAYFYNNIGFYAAYKFNNKKVDSNYSFNGNLTPTDIIDGYKFTGNTEYIRSAITAGAVYDFSDFLAVYIGAGMGNTDYYYEVEDFFYDNNGSKIYSTEWAVDDDWSFAGFETETGAMLQWKNIYIIAGITTNYKKTDFSFGLGYAINLN